MKSYLKRKLQRGFTMIETLLVMALVAAALVGVFVLYDNVDATIKANHAKSALLGPVRQLADYIEKVHVADCNGAAAPAVIPANAVLGATAAVDGAGVFQLNAATPAAANRRCRAMWQGLRRIFSTTGEGTAAGDAVYDDDAVVEWHFGSPEQGYDVGFVSNRDLSTAALLGNATTGLGFTAAAGSCPDASATAPDDVAHFALAVPLDRLAVCDKVVDAFGTIAAVESSLCVEPTAWTNDAAVDGDAALVLCLNDPRIN